jgi:hypothetical protein
MYVCPWKATTQLCMNYPLEGSMLMEKTCTQTRHKPSTVVVERTNIWPTLNFQRKDPWIDRRVLPRWKIDAIYIHHNCKVSKWSIYFRAVSKLGNHGCLSENKTLLYSPPFHTNRYGSNASETLMDNKTLVGYLKTMVGYVYLKNPDTNKVNWVPKSMA